MKSKLKTLVLAGALGGIVAAVAKKLQAGRAGSASTWQSTTDSRPAEPAPFPVQDSPDEVLVDNAPEPAGLPDEPVTPEAAGPQSTGPAPDPLTDPLPDLTDEDEQRG